MVVGELLRDGQALGRCEHRDGDRARHQDEQLLGGHGRIRREGQSTRHLAHDPHASGGEAEDRDRHDASDDDDEGHRQGRRDPLSDEQGRECDHPDHDRRFVELRELMGELTDLLDEGPRRPGHAEDLGELTDDDRQPQPGHEADAHAIRDEARHEPDPCQTGDREYHPQDDGKGRRHRPVVGSLPGGDRRDQRR